MLIKILEETSWNPEQFPINSKDTRAGGGDKEWLEKEEKGKSRWQF